MEIEVNLDKKYLLIIFSTLFVFTTAFIVYAVDPSILGHPSSEISGFPNCSEAQSLTHNSSGFFCASPSSESSFENLEIDSLNVTGKIYAGHEIVHTSNKEILYASCPLGKKVLSCHGYNGAGYKSYHLINETSCGCFGRQSADYPTHCYAVCARIS